MHTLTIPANGLRHEFARDLKIAAKALGGVLAIALVWFAFKGLVKAPAYSEVNAKDAVEARIAANPREISDYLYLAKLNLLAGDESGATAVIGRATRIDPSVRARIGLVYFEAGQTLSLNHVNPALRSLAPAYFRKARALDSSLAPHIADLGVKLD
jgi:hypothetical protein